jgi:ribosomal RNA-processing protein 9
LRAFAPASVASIPINGFVNSMQFISVPSGTVQSSSWSTTVAEGTEDSADSRGKVAGDKQDLLLVAAVSQEPRLGRWMRLKEGVKNGALIVHLTQGAATTAA